MANMYLVCGISGSGKTTLSKQLAKEHNLLRLGVDDFYAKVNGDECDRRGKFEVWIEFFKAIHNTEINGIDCVVEASGITMHQRREFVEWFPTFKHHLIFVEADAELRKKNNMIRRRQIPEWRMDEMTKQVQEPDTKSDDNKFDSITIIENRGNQFEQPIALKGRCALFEF
jgi:predicted kinase